MNEGHVFNRTTLTGRLLRNCRQPISQGPRATPFRPVPEMCPFALTCPAVPI